MINRQLLSIISIIVSVLLALGIYLYFAQIEDKNIKPIQIIPDNAAFVIESNNTSSQLKRLQILHLFDSLLLKNENIAQFHNKLLFYDSLIQTNESYFKLVLQRASSILFFMLLVIKQFHFS